MNSTLTILVGAAAALVLAVMAASTLKPADGSFAGGSALAPARPTRSEDMAAVTIPRRRDGRPPDYVVGTDSLARDRRAWQEIEAAAKPQESPPAPVDPAEAQQGVSAEPAPGTPADDPAR
jgi:hypothetical protein